MRNLNFIMGILILTYLVSCKGPDGIIFGKDPLQQIQDQGERFKKLPEEDRALLVSYLGIIEIGKAFNKDAQTVAGKTVKEVLRDAKTWQLKIKEEEVKAAKIENEEKKLKEKEAAEREAVTERINQSVLVVVIDKKVFPEDHEQGRYDDQMRLTYRLKNQSKKAIKQLKGDVIFTDLVGDKIGSLPIRFDEPIQPGKTLETTTGLVWKINGFSPEIKAIARTDFSSMKTRFAPSAIAFHDGEVIKSSGINE